MLEEIKKLIEQNEEVKNKLQGCSDDFILENSALILRALSDTEVIEGHKMDIWVEGEELLWDYKPVTNKAIKEGKIKNISKRYTFGLPNEQNFMYLVTLNDLEWTESKRALVEPIKNILDKVKSNETVKGFWLYGKQNSGKTFAAIALLNMIASQNKKVAFMMVQDLVEKTQETMLSFDKSYVSLIDAMKKADVAVLDDVSSTRLTPWFKENVLLPILDYRARSNKTTIFTSNWELDTYTTRMNYNHKDADKDEIVNNKIASRIKELINKEIKIG